jgi:hypothetical protein
LKIFVEVLSHHGKYQCKILSSQFNAIVSCPHIPRLAIDPWQNIPDSFLLKNKIMLHLRTRDFSDPYQIEKFIEQATNRLGRNHSVLLVFGDSYMAPREYEVKPWEAIGIAKKYFSKVGVVVNPTPVFRSINDEIFNFRLKLTESPDFIVTQCVYDLKSTLNFFEIAGVGLNNICINLGYWKKNTPFKKLGIANPNSLTKPPLELVKMALKECFGIYVCGNTLNLEDALQQLAALA